MPERLGAAEAAATPPRKWTLFEPVHIVSYFAAEPIAAFEQAGLTLPFPAGMEARTESQSRTEPS